MNEKTKKYLGWSIILLILVTTYGIFIGTRAYSQAVQPSSFRSFSVQGDGKVTAIPDIAKFDFGLITEGGKDIAKIQEENTDKMNKAIDYLKNSGIDAKDIKTENYSLNPKYQYYDCSPRIYGTDEAKPCPPPEIVGYTINQRVSVKIRDFSKIGDIISGVVGYGANNVSQLYFETDDPSLLMERARELAIKKAMEKATKVAKAGGFKVGRLISIEEGGVNPYPVYRNYAKDSLVMGMGGGVEEMSAPSIEAGSQEVNINITLRYEIK